MMPVPPHTPRRRQALDELDAHLHGAHHALQALLALLAACPQPVTLEPRALRLLLLPLADGVEQAAQVARSLARPPPPR
jgi:hypothetical protein